MIRTQESHRRSMRTPIRAHVARTAPPRRAAPAPVRTPARAAPSPLPPLSPEHLLVRARRLGHGPAVAAAVQRKSGNLTSAAAMTASAPTGTTVFSDTHTYEDVVAAVGAYHDAAATPNNDHGRQLVQLQEIRRHLTRWENKYGLVSTPIPSRTFGPKTVDKRRAVLNTLSGLLATEVTTVEGQGLARATLDHQQDRAALLQVVNGALQSNEQILSNSAEWILSGRTALYAVTPTGDSYARLRQDGKNPAADEAFFPAARTGTPGDVLSPAATYDSTSLANNAGVTIRVGGKNTGGWQEDRAVAVVGAANLPQARVELTLRHEVQHDADRHGGRESLSGVRQASQDFEAAGLRVHPATKAITAVGQHPNVPASRAAIKAARAEVQLQRYKTEYRAYSYQEGAAGGTYTALNDTVQNQLQDGLNFSARQRAIFRHIYAGYPEIKKGWDDNDLLSDGATRFRDAVAAYWRPDTEGFNKINSVRIDAFYARLDAVGTKAARTSLEHMFGVDAGPVTARVTNAADGTVVALLQAADDLTPADADSILNDSPAMLRKIDDHLGGAARTAVLQALTTTSAMGGLQGLF